MYMDTRFRFFRRATHVAMTFEWQHVFRLIYTNGTTHATPLHFWMGDSRGRWEGDTLVVDVTNHNDQTWFDMAGNFHSDALHVVERYTMLGCRHHPLRSDDRGSKVFTRPWTISMPLHRQKRHGRGSSNISAGREMEEAQRRVQARTRAPGTQGRRRRCLPFPPQAARAAALGPRRRPGTVPRMADGKPDLNGLTEADAGGANWGFEPHDEPFTPGGRGVMVDPKPRQAAVSAVGARGEARTGTRPGARLRRPDGPLLSRAACRGRCTCPRRFTSSRRRTLGRHPARADVVAHRAAGQDARTCPTRSASGRAIRSVTGTATRSSSKRRT